MTYKIEYDHTFPGFRLEHNGEWVETYRWVEGCLDCIARREGTYIPDSHRGSESAMLSHLMWFGVEIECEDW